MAVLAACSASPGTPSPAASATPSTLSDDERQKALNTPTDLTFWTWVPEIAGEIALFQKAYPNIKVKVENVGQGADHYRKMRTVLTSGQGVPDVAQVEFQYIQSFTVTKNLLDLAPYGAAALAPQFTDWVWKQVQFGSNVWAIPQDAGPLGSLYRQDIMEAAGASGEVKTWDEYYELAKKIKANTKSYIGSLSPNEAGIIMGYLWQAGAKPFSYDGDATVKINLTDEISTKVMTFWQKMLKEELVANDAAWTDGWYQGLANGKYAGWLTAAWGPVFLQGTAGKTSGKWRATTLPQWDAGANISGNWGGSSNVVLNTSKNPIAAYELATWINTNIESTLMFANKQFFFPVTKATIEDPRFVDQKAAFYGGQQVNKLFSEISNTVDPTFGWLPFMDVVYSSFSDTIGKQIASRGDLLAGMAAWEKTLTDYGTAQGFTVTK
ncbi:MAG: extracellular solute-binding protein [Micropruina sp.]